MLGSRIRQLRIDMNMTQKEFAALLELSESMISLYESEKRQPSYDILNSIANKCNVTTDYLFGRTDVKFSNEEYAKKYSDLSPDSRKKAEEYFEMLKTLDKLKLEQRPEDIHKKA
jgi:transcriptional regulator with XRE-family HTH domain